MNLSRPILILLVGYNIWSFGEGMLGPLLAVFAGEVGGSLMSITLAWATFMMVTGVMQIFIGRLLVGYNIAKILVLGYALNAIFTFCYALVSTPAELYMVQVGMGFAAALAGPSWYTLYSRYSNPDYAIEEWGYAGGQGQIITGIAILTGGTLVELFSFSTLFIVMGTVQIIATIWQAQILLSLNEQLAASESKNGLPSSFRKTESNAILKSSY